MAPIYRPTWAEVDLRRLRSNLVRLRRRMPKSTAIMLVVKANAYGHGAVEVSRAAEESGCIRWLGVSSVEEGIALRDAGVRKPILILGSLYPFESTLTAIRYGLRPTVASLDGVRFIAQAAQALGRLEPGGRRAQPLDCHLKIDTGMGRIGLRSPAVLEVVDALRRTPGVRLEGVYTHLARAEDDPVYTRAQLALFRECVRGIERAGLQAPLRHAANSAAALRFPESRWDMVRPGLAAYGLYGEGFEPVLSLKTRIVFLKSVGPNTHLGYGRHFKTRRNMRVATLPIGYGDGLPRLLSLGPSRAHVLVKGRRCPMVGAMSMDMTLIDVSGVPDVHIGDETVLIGRSGAWEIGARELAAAARTIPYEIVTRLAARVPRVYLR
ncbi:MAG: alanine racemase [Elusimicrobiota bacterium]